MTTRPVIKNYHSGRLWWGCEQLAHHEFHTIDGIKLDEPEDEDTKFKAVEEWLDEHGYAHLVVEAYISVGEDDDVNCSTYEIDEVFYPDEFDKALDECPFLTDDERDKSMNSMQDYIDNLREDDFTLYEPDYDVDE